MQKSRTVVYNPAPGEKLQFGMKPGKSYQETYEVPDPWYFAPPSDGFKLCETVRSSTYSTQGYGADRYAENSARMRADMYTAAGFTVEVRAVSEDTVSHAEFADIGFPKRRVYLGQVSHTPRFWQVWVKGENVAGVFTPFANTPFAETVRKCWERGVNPRVYWPFLPHGYEEKHGFDYFGKTTTGGVS